MFKRLILEDWSVTCAVLAFAFTAGVFIYTTWRAARIPTNQRARLASLPLDETANTDHQP